MSRPEEYPTNLTDGQWHLLQPLLPPRKWRPGGPGRPPYDRRRVINGILYVTKTGGPWDRLPPSFGCWKTVYGYFNTWSREGVWQALMDRLTRQERQRQGRKFTPSAGCVDSQSVKMANQRGPKGYDGGKNVNGRKRHVLVDTLGLLLSVLVTAADEGDRVGLIDVLTAYFSSGQPFTGFWEIVLFRRLLYNIL